MYAKCGAMTDARRVFDGVRKPTLVSWTALLLGYAENREGSVALGLFSRMKALGHEPDAMTYVAAVKACTSLAVNGNEKADCLERGRRIHVEIGSHHLDHHLQNTLIEMYAKCGSMVDARRVFDTVHTPDVVSWTALILGYADNGKGYTALDLLSRMKEQGCEPNCVTYVAALKACTSLAVTGDTGPLERGREIHSEIGHHLDQYVQNALIDMYAKCGSMVEAARVFDSIPKPGVVAWNALLQGYAENGEGQAALELFSRMKARSGCAPNHITYIAGLKACSNLAATAEGNAKRDYLRRGRQIHMEIGSNTNLPLQNTLISMYSKCGSMLYAREVFDSIPNPNVVSWNALLLGYAENGEGDTALGLFSKMKTHGCSPNYVTYIAVLKACTSSAEGGDSSKRDYYLERGREIHSGIGSFIPSRGSQLEILILQNSLVDMYANCGSMIDARQVFGSIRDPSVVSWTALLLGYAENGEGSVALDLFARMKATGCVPNTVTYVAALKACTSVASANGRRRKSEYLERGREIHLEIGSSLDLYVQCALIDMYSKCGSMVDARAVFDSLEDPSVASWTALVLGYAENGEGDAALEVFSSMKARGCAPNCVTYVAVLKACGLLGALTPGRKFHSEIGEFNARVVASLVSFYAKCGSMEDARKVFEVHSRTRDVSAWNALLAGYASFGDTAAALSLFEAMQDTGIQPDGITFLCLLLCCSHAGLVKKAREYYDAMPAFSVKATVVHGNCLVDALGRANQMKEAVAFIRRMPYAPDSVTWSILLAACCKWGRVQMASMAFQSLVAMDNRDGSAHVLLAHAPLS